MSDPSPKRRWYRHVALILLVGTAIYAGYTLRWINERNAFVGRDDVFGYASIGSGYPRQQAPWFLSPFGARGYAEISILMRNEEPSVLRSAERLFPEAHVSCVPEKGAGRENFEAVLEACKAQGEFPAVE